MTTRLAHRCALYAALAIPLLAAAAPDYMPPPGYYRVDAKSSFPEAAGGALHHDVDGATGSETVTQQGSRRQYAGTEPHNLCIEPDKPATALLPPGMCPFKGPAVSGGVATFTADCKGMKGTMTMRKIDASTWELASRMQMGPADSGMKPMTFQLRYTRLGSQCARANK